jgi:hypothetical protein
MVFIELHEAQLFKMLSSFFGRERVVPHMSVLSICGGELPEDYEESSEALRSWAKATKCLFTIVDDDDTPKMVVEFFSGFEHAVDPVEEEHQRYLSRLLPAAGIRYVTISDLEFSELLDPKSSLDFFSLLEAKVIS